MFTKKVKYYENGKLVEKEVPLKGQELIEAKIIELKLKLVNGTITEEEKEELKLLK